MSRRSSENREFGNILESLLVVGLVNDFLNASRGVTSKEKF